MTADAQIKSFFQRWERLEAEKKELGDLLKDLFAEAKSVGYETKALRAAFRLKAKQDLDSPADAEFEAVVDTYLDALNGSSRATRAYARENIEQFDPATGEIEADVSAKLVETIAAGVQTEVGRAALIAAVDIMIDREEEEIATSAGGESEEVAKNAVASASGPDEKRATNSPEEAPEFLTKAEEEAEAKGAVTVDTVSRANEESDRQRASGAGPADGRQHGGGDPLAAAGDHAPSLIAKPKYVLRPHCRNPEACGGYGANHCHPCQKAMREKAEEVA